MKTITERRRKALYNWACNQSTSYLASMLVNILSNKDIAMLVKDNSIPIPKN